MRGREAATWLIAPALLVSVALVQYWRVAEHDQSTWAGVGFGMFATFEQETHRRVTVEVTVDGRTIAALLPAALLDEARHLPLVPSAAATQHLADELAGHRWRIDDELERAVTVTGADETGRRVERVVVTVQGAQVHDGDPPTLAFEVVRRAEARPPP